MIGPRFPDEAPAVVSNRTLWQFAALTLAVFGTLFALSAYRHHGVPTTGACVALGLALAVGLPGLACPPLIRPVFVAAMALTRPIGHVISILLMGLIYYGFITPLGLAFRLAGRDSLALRRPAVDSYWIPKLQPTSVTRYLRQYQTQ
jgi:hypothetical protein